MHELRIEGTVTRAPYRSNVKHSVVLFSVLVIDLHEQLTYRAIATRKMAEAALLTLSAGDRVQLIGKPSVDVWAGDGRIELHLLIYPSAINKLPPKERPPQRRPLMVKAL